jgi:mRNA interferase RelE/StbE
VAYTVELAPAAQRQLRRLPRGVQVALIDRITGLEQNPRPSGCKKLSGTTNRFRIRHGDYRVIYEVHDNTLVVIVVKIAHRSNAY